MAQRMIETLPTGASRYYDPATGGTVTVSTAVYRYDDFQGIALNSTNDYTLTGANSGTAAVVASTAGGIVRLTTGTTSGNATELATYKTWQGDKNPGFELRYRQNDVDQSAIFIGLTDTATEGGATLPMTYSGTTLTTTATDAFGFFQDSAATTDAIRFAAVDTDTDTAVLTSTATPADASWHVLRAQVDSTTGYVEAFVDGTSLGKVAVPTDVVMCLYMGIVTRNNAAETLDIDYLRVWSDR